MDEINFLTYWRLLEKRKKLIGIITSFALALSIVIAFFMPDMYESTASILPPQQDNPFSRSGIQMPVGLGAIPSSFMGLQSPADVWEGILISQNLRDSIIARFNLRELYDEETIEDTREKLDEMVFIEKMRMEIITITIRDSDPERSARIANGFVEELDRINKDLIMTSGKRMRIFIEKRLDGVKIELAKAEDAIKAFQENYGAIELEGQSRTIFETLGRLQGELIAKKLELQTLLTYAPTTNPKAEILMSQIKELKESLKELEVGEKDVSNRAQNNILIPTAKIPDLTLKNMRLIREAKVQETLYELLTQQYEVAKITEAKDSPTVQILDTAKTPEKKAKSKRLMTVVLSVFMALLFSVFLVFSMEYMNRLKGYEAHLKKDAIP